MPWQEIDVLSSVLPGLREARTPLAVGYTWLIDLWLAAGDHLPTARPATGPFAKLWDLGNYSGKGAVLAASAFTAYLIGTFLEVDPLHLWAYGGRPRWITRTRNLFRRGWLRRVRVLPVSSQTQQDLVAYAREDFGFTIDESRRLYIPHGIMHEERQLATRLQAANVDIFNRYNRLLAESTFRINVTMPLVMLGLLVIWGTDTGTSFKLPLAVAVMLFGATLLRQGVLRAIQSRDIIAQAVVAGVVRSRFLEQLSEESGRRASDDCESRPIDGLVKADSYESGT